MSKLSCVVVFLLAVASCTASVAPDGEDDSVVDPAPRHRDTAKDALVALPPVDLPPAALDASIDLAILRDASSSRAEADASVIDAPGVRDGHFPDGAGISGDAGPSLPVVVLTVPSRAIDRLGDDKVVGRVRILGGAAVFRADGQVDPAVLANAPASLDTPIGISLRGALSRTFPQKSFSIELRDDQGQEREQPVLGMPSDTDWALVACWSDKTCMRNALSYALARRMGEWQPRTRFVDVVYNGQHQGLYLLVEPPRRGKNRVDLPKSNPDAGAPQNEAYIFRREADGKGGNRDFISPTLDPRGVPTVYTHHYPNEKVITPAQRAYLRDHVAAFEKVVYGPSFADPAMGYRAWLDVERTADYYLMQELTNNVDAYFKSLYMQKQPDVGGTRGKLLLGPAWDFNFALGNADYQDAWKPTSWAIQRGVNIGFCSGRLPAPTGCGTCTVNTNEACATCACFNVPWVPSWVRKLWTDPYFRTVAGCRLQKWRKTAITPEVVDAALAGWKEELRPHIGRHYARWPDLRKKSNANPCDYDATTRTFKTNTRFKVEGLPDPNCGARELTHEQFLDFEVEWLRKWVHLRLAFLDENIGTLASAQVCP